MSGGLFGLPLKSTTSTRANDYKRGLEPVDLQDCELYEKTFARADLMTYSFGDHISRTLAVNDFDGKPDLQLRLPEEP